jgi:retinol dehydrogenase 12
VAVVGVIVYWVIWHIFCRFPARYGAYTELYAGFSRDLTLEDDQGAFIVPWGQKDTMRPDMEKEVAKGEKGVGARLWEWCDTITSEYV